MPQYTMRDFRYDELVEAVKKINRKSKRLRLTFPEVTINVVKVETRKVRVQLAERGLEGVEYETNEYGYQVPVGLTDANFDLVDRVYYTVDVNGIAPIYSDWKFKATIEHTVAGNLLKRVPQADGEPEDPADLLKDYRDAPGICQHCNNLRKRANTFVLQHVDGTMKQIGRQCLRAFLPTSSMDPQKVAEMLAAAAEELSRFEGGGGEDPDEPGMGGGYAQHFQNTDYALTVAVAYIARDGYVSAKAVQNGFQGETTRHWVVEHLDPRPPKRTRYGTLEPDNKIKEDDITEENRAYARQVREWARTHEGTSDFSNNLRVIAANDVVSFKNIGILISAIPSYKRATEAAVQYAKKADRAESNFVGTVGKRETFAGLKVQKVIPIETDFGRSFLYLFEDQDGNDLKWFASRSQDLDAGDTLDLKATVKNHEVYIDRKGKYPDRKQTGLSRGVVVSHVRAAKPSSAEVAA